MNDNMVLPQSFRNIVTGDNGKGVHQGFCSLKITALKAHHINNLHAVADGLKRITELVSCFPESSGTVLLDSSTGS